MKESFAKVKIFRKKYIVILCTILILVTGLTFLIVKKPYAFQKALCLVKGHAWSRHWSDDWLWQYNHEAKDSRYPNGYKYRYKQNYVICLHCKSYLFSNLIVDIMVYPIKTSELPKNPQEVRHAFSGQRKDPRVNIANGTYRVSYPNGVLESEWNYKNGKLNGLCKEYYPKGNLKGYWFCENDKMQGEAKFFYSNGTLLWEGLYINGRLEGISKEYYKDGKPKRVDNYKKGINDGVSRLYFPNGNLKWERNFINGKRHCANKEYYENGQLYLEGYFNKGKGNFKEYYQNGTLMGEANYDNGVVSYTKKYDSGGNLLPIK
jgi:antitoxin component YwqK of YwqJK toxin-antitoxin module